MATESIFGTIRSGIELEAAAADTMALWMPTYIRELERQYGRTLGLIPPPRMYTNRNRFEAFPEDQMPLCIVVSSGLVDTPLKEGDGTYRAWFSLGVGFLASAKDEDAATFLSKFYAAAGRAVLLQKPSLGGFASGTEWIDETYDDEVITEDERTMKATYLIFRVLLDKLVARYGGPVEPVAPNPATQPGSQWPTAQTVNIDIEVMP